MLRWFLLDWNQRLSSLLSGNDRCYDWSFDLLQLFWWYIHNICRCQRMHFLLVWYY